MPAKKIEEANVIRELAISYLSELPRPASMYVNKALRIGDVSLLPEVLDELCELYEAYAAEQGYESGNTRAYRTALVLRAVFETHSNFKVTAKNIDNVPNNEFCECLKDLFAVAGLDSKFYHFARRACNCPPTDAEFLEVKRLIETSPEEFRKMAEFY